MVLRVTVVPGVSSVLLKVLPVVAKTSVVSELLEEVLIVVAVVPGVTEVQRMLTVGGGVGEVPGYYKVLWEVL